MFNWFKKKKDGQEDENKYKYDPTNVRLNQLRLGSFFEYDLKTWEVKAAYEYDWGNDNFADEFQIQEGKTTLFLYVEEDGDLYCTFNQKINVHELPEDVVDTAIQKGSPPMRIQYENETYYRQSENVGYQRSQNQTEWSELVSWSYATKGEDKLMTIEQWGEEDFNASIGWVVNEYEFSNIVMP
jgi:Domain of unknown function (DUF4178)